MRALLIISLICWPVFSYAERVVLFLGDSLTEGYGVRRDQAYPALLEYKWNKDGRQIKVVNGAESGSLASGLADRIEFYAKRFQPALIVIASGGNDARQMTPVKKIEVSLKQAIQKAKATKAKVILVGMRIFPNLGKEYVAQFSAMYPRLAKEEKIPLISFLLSAVAGDRKLNQPDGFHPNADGHAKIAESIGPELEKML